MTPDENLEQWLTRVMHQEAEDILARLTNPSSEALMRIMYNELIKQVTNHIKSIEDTTL